jgi:hypothetical protein
MPVYKLTCSFVHTCTILVEAENDQELCQATEGDDFDPYCYEGSDHEDWSNDPVDAKVAPAVHEPRLQARKRRA